MSSPSVEIIICMGSSCFSRGNKKVLQQIKEFLSERKLEQQVVFRGAHCFGNCEDGPVMKINGKLIQKVDPENVSSILEEYFEGKVKS